MNGVHCLCSSEFFAALTGHAKVEKAFENWQNGAILINDIRRGFTYGGITFEEYRGQATDTNGTVRRFIAAGEAHAFPLGTIDTFGTYFAPADFNETVNTVGQPLYAKQEPRKFDRVTGVAQFDEGNSLHDSAIVDIETWNDPAGKHTSIVDWGPAIVERIRGAPVARVCGYVVATTASSASTRVNAPSYSALPTIEPSQPMAARRTRWLTFETPPEATTGQPR